MLDGRPVPHAGDVVAAVDRPTPEHAVGEPQRGVLEDDEVDVFPAERGNERVVQPGVVEERAARGNRDGQIDVTVRTGGAAATEPKT